jgi:hypothetical protein
MGHEVTWPDGRKQQLIGVYLVQTSAQRKFARGRKAIPFCS